MIPLAATAPLVSNPVTIFLIVMGIILLAPVLLSRLRIPHIIGMIVAGMIVGPYGVNILDRDSSFEIFGQVGLLYLMFLAGLEIDMFHLRLNLRRGAVFGTLSFLIPMAMGVLASVYVLKTSWITAFLLASMFASHTLIGYPVVARFGITKSSAVLISVVATIICVIGALVVLAACVNIHATGQYSLWGQLWLIGKSAIYCGAVLYLYPRLTRWFFKNYSEKVTQYIFVMVLVFLSAWASGKIGLEPVLGAFFAGLVLNRYVPFHSPLMNSIEFVGNALFIPYFLIGVGMMINLSVLTHGNTLWVALVMLVIALVSKWLAAYITQKVYGMDGPDRRVMFGLTTAHTAVALAVVTIGYNMVLPDGSRMMDETILNGTILVILITCAIAPIVTSQGAIKVKIKMLGAPETLSSTPLSAIHRILVPVANPLTASSLSLLATLMRRRKGGVRADRFFALHVRNDNTRTSKEVGADALGQALRAASAVDVEMEAIERYDLNTVAGILNTIAEREISAVVMGMHRKANVIDTFLGSKLESLIKQTNLMVVLSRCYIPVNTVTRICVFVPEKAEYETGFRQWVNCLSSLAAEIGCRIIFCANRDTRSHIAAVIHDEDLGIRHEYRAADDLDDFMLLANRVLEDDLLVVIGARADTLSYTPQVTDMVLFLQRYFDRNNMLMIYPSQQSADGAVAHTADGDLLAPNHGMVDSGTTFADPLGVSTTPAPSPLRHLSKYLKRLAKGSKRRR